VYIYARVIKRGKRGATSDGGERFLLLFCAGEMEIHKTKRVTSAVRTDYVLRENTKEMKTTTMKTTTAISSATFNNATFRSDDDAAVVAVFNTSSRRRRRRRSTSLAPRRRRRTTTMRFYAKENFAMEKEEEEEEKEQERERMSWTTTTTTRRAAVAMMTTAATLSSPSSFCSFCSPSFAAAATAAASREEETKEVLDVKKFFQPGPFSVRQLPKVEHVSASVYPLCTGIACRLSVKALVPFPPPVNPDELFPNNNNNKDTSGSKNSGSNATPKAPFPLAVFTPGFLVDAESYDFLARRLCSFGYVVLRYDKSESLNETLDDVVSASLLEDLITWASYGSGTLSNIVDPEEVLLIGHSRGGKISALESLFDERVKCLALVDPVDNTQYAPLGPGFPSAVMGMESDETAEKKKYGPPATLVVGGLKGGECAPLGSNYSNFFKAAQVARKKQQKKGGEDPWGFTLDCGHFDFLDEKSFIQSSVCDVGNLDDKVTKEITAAAIAFHADQTFRNRNRKSGSGRGSGNNSSSGSSSNSISDGRRAFFEQSKMKFGDDSLVELV